MYEAAQKPLCQKPTRWSDHFSSSDLVMMAVNSCISKTITTLNTAKDRNSQRLLQFLYMASDLG